MGGAKDNVHFQDGVQAGLETVAKPPNVPCPKCGAETKEHEVDPDTKEVKSRICSARKCRKVVSLN